MRICLRRLRGSKLDGSPNVRFPWYDGVNNRGDGGNDKAVVFLER